MNGTKQWRSKLESGDKEMVIQAGPPAFCGKHHPVASKQMVFFGIQLSWLPMSVCARRHDVTTSQAFSVAECLVCSIVQDILGNPSSQQPAAKTAPTELNETTSCHRWRLLALGTHDFPEPGGHIANHLAASFRAFFCGGIATRSSSSRMAYLVTVEVPSMKRVRKSTLAWLNIPSFKETTMNCEWGKCVRIMWPMFWVWLRSKAESISSKMYLKRTTR